MVYDDARVGELIGTVTSMVGRLDYMQKTQEANRQEFLDIFKEMRDGVKEIANSLAQHVKDDNAIHAQVLSVAQWRIGENGNNGAAAQLDTLWDEHNRTAGAFKASRFIGGALWALFAIAVGYFMPHKN
jgi:hypothetical protein